MKVCQSPGTSEGALDERKTALSFLGTTLGGTIDRRGRWGAATIAGGGTGGAALLPNEKSERFIFLLLSDA